MAKGWRSLGRASGDKIGSMSIKTYVCCGCGAQYKAEKPGQCRACGRMDFLYFDSNGEAMRWAHLQLLEKAGHISELVRQVPFPLMAARADGLAVKVGEYIADFCYVENGNQIIEDYKSLIAPEAALKLRWMEGMGLPVRVNTAKGNFDDKRGHTKRRR